ncbi:MAG: hypothetical protein IJ958_10285 [Agathobacter sp.]|nr:hypothetical protein [Agathobacter sp.]
MIKHEKRKGYTKGEIIMKCAYCDFEGKMTKEHVIPKGFINHMNWENQIVAIEKAPARVINAELMIKDVCATCNNGELSKLDAYALNLFIECNDAISISTRKFYFKYNYDYLARWLLKICFNSARANGSDYDASVYQKNTNYILNREKASSKISIYATLLGYDNINPELARMCSHMQKDRTYEFDWFRIGPFKNLNIMTYYSALRVVIINSIAFLVVVSDSEEEYEEIRKNIFQGEYNFCELQKNGKVWLKKDYNFMMDSFRSNMAIKENFMKKRPKVEDSLRVLRITRDEIEREDYSSIAWLIEKFTSNRDVLRDVYQKVVIVVEGYEEEKREIYQVPEYQKYFETVFSVYPQIIWMLFLSVEEENPFMAMLWAAVNDNCIKDSEDGCRDIYPNKQKVTRLLLGFYRGINLLCHKFVFDSSINMELTDKITQMFLEGFNIER